MCPRCAPTFTHHPLVLLSRVFPVFRSLTILPLPQLTSANPSLLLAMWGRYPNFLLVDFYDSGNGSVFEVAAKANNVTYPGGCCGKVKSLATAAFVDPTWLVAEFLVFLTFFVLG
jgi:hypothetical protein